MIKRVLASFFLVELFVALSIYLVWQSNGTTVHVVELGVPFLSFLRTTSAELNDFKIEIPNIPMIPMLEETNGFMLVINVIVQFFNGVINVLNFVVTVVNTIIQLIQFIFLILKNFIVMKDSIAST